MGAVLVASVAVGGGGCSQGFGYSSCGIFFGDFSFFNVPGNLLLEHFALGLQIAVRLPELHVVCHQIVHGGGRGWQRRGRPDMMMSRRNVQPHVSMEWQR